MPGWHDAGSMEASEGDLRSRGYGAVLWEPDHKTVHDARVTQFMSWLADGRGPRFDRYEELWQWSVTEPARFWAAIWDYFGVLGEWDHDLASVLVGETMPDVRWFTGATLNYARNALRTAWSDPGRPAIIFSAERSQPRVLTYAQLAAEVARVARGLRSLGVGRGAAEVPALRRGRVAPLHPPRGGRPAAVHRPERGRARGDQQPAEGRSGCHGLTFRLR